MLPNFSEARELQKHNESKLPIFCLTGSTMGTFWNRCDLLATSLANPAAKLVSGRR